MWMDNRGLFIIENRACLRNSVERFVDREVSLSAQKFAGLETKKYYVSIHCLVFQDPWFQPSYYEALHYQHFIYTLCDGTVGGLYSDQVTKFYLTYSGVCKCLAIQYNDPSLQVTTHILGASRQKRSMFVAFVCIFFYEYFNWIIHSDWYYKSYNKRPRCGDSVAAYCSFSSENFDNKALQEMCTSRF